LAYCDLYRLNEIAWHERITEFDKRWEFRVGLMIGIFSAEALFLTSPPLQLNAHRSEGTLGTETRGDPHA
jgi:hypothetical protein